MCNDLIVYKQQLSQIEDVFKAAGSDGVDPELLKLHGELKEVIKLTEESMLEDAKSKLLSEVEAAYPECIDEKKSSTSPFSQDFLASLTAKKFLLTLASATGVRFNHSVVVSEVLIDKNNTCKVFFNYPTESWMVSCQNSPCSSKCKLNHGFSVSISQLKEHPEVCGSFAEVGKTCLVLQDLYEDCWMPGKVVRHSENGDFSVKLLSTDKIVDVCASCIAPYFKYRNDDDDAESGSQSSSSSDDDDDCIRSLSVDVQPSASTIVASTSFGSWQTYTKGFGLKMMLRQGYQMGSGLGSRQQGRVNPVSIEVLPKGKSLDHIVQLRNESQHIDDGDVKILDSKLKVGKSSRRRQRQKARDHRAAKRLAGEVPAKKSFFGAVNSLTGGKTANFSGHWAANTINAKNNVQVVKASDTQLNITEYELQKLLSSLEKEQSSLVTQLKTSTSSFSTERLKSKSDSIQNRIGETKQMLDRVHTQKNARKSKKKLEVF